MQPPLVFTSSHRTTGFHGQTTRLEPTSPVRPDGLNGGPDDAARRWDNAAASLGWQPKDSAERFRAMLDADRAPPAPGELRRGGLFCDDGMQEGRSDGRGVYSGSPPADKDRAMREGNA